MSIYHDLQGHAYHRRFVVVNEMEDTMIAHGVYEDYNTAVGEVMLSIWDFAESYKAEGDVFEIGEMENGENGDFIRIRFKSHYWDRFVEEYYHILYCDEWKPELDDPDKALYKKRGKHEATD